jgi:hypothetical protein
MGYAMQIRFLLMLLLCALGTVIGQSQDVTPVAPDVEAITARLQQTPVFNNFTSDRVREIYAQGQILGNRPQVFTKLGDSDTAQGAFLRPMGMGSHPGFYCDLGEHTELQETLDYFSSVPPRDGVSNSFDSTSLGAHKGFSTASIFDSWWAQSQSKLCHVGETPLDCEYRIVQPSTAFIMFGLIDVQIFTPDEYRANMVLIIDRSIEMGVIPVLSTFLVLENNPKQDWHIALAFDDVLLDLAEEYQIPLINLWHELQPLPNHGVSPDQVHLGYPSSGFCNFNGAQEKYGGVLRNFLTLTALDILRQEVFLAPSTEQ